MSCGEVLDVLQSYIDGEIDAEVARQVATHLTNCDHCDHESHVYVRIKASLRRRRDDVDPDVLAALSDYGHRLLEGGPDAVWGQPGPGMG
jgi:anti-sigma factor RsiW